ncbi:hypothetical protein NBH00_23665 [Paraconexibacter antarcticus]|uniref:Rhomboid family intramembrane serine protease n=1 Tax=Paraconexibacter antarcticus TaxID=2949664 RepID=A0ABY5DQL9_9ACTN|nr:hypothetical protein [Paraconexibacter antarcticus]UTI64323.1 hypothetical protein NBH00_23665 [Paraconexibacter antarcticus]
MSEAFGEAAWRSATKVGRWGALAYIPAIVLVAGIRAVTGADLAHRWATSPSLVDHGRVWTLFTSALVLDRVQGLQLILAIALTWALLFRHGPGALWSALLLGHVGSTLIAYAGSGVLWETGSRLPHAYVNPDFGISCVWITILAMLATDVVLTLRPRRQAWVATLVIMIAYTALAIAGDSTIAEAEHTLAVTAGIAAMLWTRRGLMAGGAGRLGHRAATRIRRGPHRAPAAAPAAAVTASRTTGEQDLSL